jgi:asparagine synthase (glutamine-hydrolysing)
MRSICGWIGHGGDHGDIERLICDMGRRMDRVSSQTPHIVTSTASALSISAQEPASNLCERDGVLAALSGHFSWKKSDLAAVAEAEGAAVALLRGFEESGPDVLKYLSGAFNAAIVRESDNQVLVATDRAGANPVAYAEIGETLVFGPDAATLLIHPVVDSRMNEQAIFDYIYFHFVPSPESVYGDVRRLFPGQYLKRSNGRSSANTYWQVDYDESAAGLSFNDLQEELLSLVRAGVTDAVDGDAVGAFLSGGVDSSTITGVLGAVRDCVPRTYSIGFDVDSYDELSYARLAAKHFNAEHREYLVTPEDIIEAVPKIACHYAEPFGNSSAVPSYLCAKMAKEDGINTLLGGDGGDELFGGNERYAKQKLFAIYDRIPAVARKSIFEPIFLSSRFGDGVAPLHKVRRYVEQAAIPMPERLQTYNFLNHFAPDQIFDESLLSRVSQQQPLEMLTDYYDNVKANSIVDKMLGLDLKFTLADNDLVKVNGTCGLAGVDAVYPLLSDDLIEFSSRLPPRWKVKGQVLRYFFKKAYEGFLPDETLRKSKHGFGLPFGEWAVSHVQLNEFVRENLENLKARRLIRADFINRLMDSYLPEHPQYYGSIVWLLLMLEQWHQQQRSG